MSWWDSYRAVYGAELRAAAREFSDHGWPVVEASPSGLLLATGTALDVVEVPAEYGRQVCAHLRDVGSVVPVAATPAGTWWFPVTAGDELPEALRHDPEIHLHAGGDAVLAPPSEVSEGYVHWRVSPARCTWALPAAQLIFAAVTEVLWWRADHVPRPGAQRPAAVVVGMRS
jgi:hypothetical protein